MKIQELEVNGREGAAKVMKSIDYPDCVAIGNLDKKRFYLAGTLTLTVEQARRHARNILSVCDEMSK